jgi:predicted ATPase with chaperone activity
MKTVRCLRRVLAPGLRWHPYARENATNRTPDSRALGESRCSTREIQNHLNRVSGPLLDWIDLPVEVPAVKFRDITGTHNGESTAQTRERVVAREWREERGGGERG